MVVVESMKCSLSSLVLVRPEGVSEASRHPADEAAALCVPKENIYKIAIGTSEI